MGVTAGEVLGVRAMTTAGQTVRLPVMLLDSTGAPVTGVLFNAAGVTVAWAKEGDSSFTAFTMATENWDEVGYGNYDIILRFGEALETAWLAAEGHLRVYVKFTATRGDTFLFKVNVADSVRDDQWTDTKAGYLDASVNAANNGTPPTAQAIATYVWVTNATGAAVAATLAGITSLKSWLGALAGKTVDAATLAEIQSTTAGAGYNNATDSQEAIRDTAPLGTAMRGTDGAELTGAAASAVSGLAGTLATAHGSGSWATATGFSTLTASDVTGAVPTVSAIATYVWVTHTTGAAVAATLAGITSLANWLRGLARSSAMNATAKTELNASGGTYDEASDSLEALATSVSTGAGAFPITLYVKDGSSVAIQNAKVRINATGGTVVATTNSLGAATFNLDSGTYTAYVGTAASYTPAASYTVVVSGAGAVTSPTGGILTVTAVALPTPTDPGAYALYNRETDEQGSAFGAGGMTVTVTGLSYSGRVDAASNLSRSVMGRSDTTDASGDWSMDIPQHCFSDGARLTITKAWTTAGGVAKTETWSADLVAPTGGATQVCWSDLAPYTSS